MWRLPITRTMAALRRDGFTLIEVLLVVALICVLGLIAVPVTGAAVGAHRFNGDAQSLTNAVGLAKMRASAGFTRARIRVNLGDNSYTLERWDKTTQQWEVEGGLRRPSAGVSFGFAGHATPPPNTQTALAFSPTCRNGVDAAAPEIADTACLTFNSRGLPIDGNGVIFGGHALYLTDGSMVYGTTVTATPRIRLWRAVSASANWIEQQ